MKDLGGNDEVQQKVLLEKLKEFVDEIDFESIERLKELVQLLKKTPVLSHTSPACSRVLPKDPCVVERLILKLSEIFINSHPLENYRLALHNIATLIEKSKISFKELENSTRLYRNFRLLFPIIDTNYSLLVVDQQNDLTAKFVSCYLRTLSIVIHAVPPQLIVKSDYASYTEFIFKITSTSCIGSSSSALIQSALRLLKVLLLSNPLLFRYFWFDFFNDNEHNGDTGIFLLMQKSLDEHNEEIWKLSCELAYLALKLNRPWIRSGVRQPPGFSYTSLSEKMAILLIAIHLNLFELILSASKTSVEMKYLFSV